MGQDRFHEIGEFLKTAYAELNWKDAEKLALEYLALAEQNKSNWNYGNAIHHVNLVLGMKELEKKDLVKAKTFLLRAGGTPGSPQLRSFGPNMSLAKALLEAGEKSVVLEYLHLVTKFWNPIFSFFRIRKWRRAIKKGTVPDFGANNIFYLKNAPKKNT